MPTICTVSAASPVSIVSSPSCPVDPIKSAVVSLSGSTIDAALLVRVSAPAPAPIESSSSKRDCPTSTWNASVAVVPRTFTVSVALPVSMVSRPSCPVLPIRSAVVSLSGSEIDEAESVNVSAPAPPLTLRSPVWVVAPATSSVPFASMSLSAQMSPSPLATAQVVPAP